MTSTDLCQLTIADAAPLLASQRLSPVELIDAHLERIASTDGRLNSFITVLESESKAAARKAEAEIGSGGYRGTLHGIPIGLKDLYYTRGVRTTIGSSIMADFVPDHDAAVTERFRDAGAVIIGKLQMHEFALGATSLNPHYGPAHNPWDLERVTGGSSGGSGSAVASGQCMGALGSDTGGSIRIPSALCGIVGLKPTAGRVSRHGVFPLSWSLDTVGPMTRTVRDAALVLNAIAGHDPRDQTSSTEPVGDVAALLGQDVSGVRVGMPREHFFDDLDSEVGEALSTAAGVLEGLGAAIDEVSVPAFEGSFDVAGTIMLAEAAEVHAENLRDRPDEFGPDLRSRLEQGAKTSAIDYIRAQRARRELTGQVDEVLRQVDILLTPTIPIPAPTIEDETAVAASDSPPPSPLSRLTRPFNLCGVPTITVPCGLTTQGLPVGMQLAGRPFDEATVLRVAHAYEQSTDWHKRRPPL